jgi:IPT/TIG domain
MPVTDSRVKSGRLTLGGVNFSCQPTAVAITPSNTSGSSESLEVLCGDILTDTSSGNLEATLDFTAVQDFTAATGQSLIGYSWSNNGQEVDFVYSPTGQLQDEWQGKVIVQALVAGGEVGSRLTSDASWRISDLRMPQRLGGGKVIGPGAGVTAPQVPIISKLTPDNGPAAGGTVVVITGYGFSSATEVEFDAVPGTEFAVVSNVELHVKSPAGTVGTADIVVKTPSGDISLPAGFTYS